MPKDDQRRDVLRMTRAATLRQCVILAPRLGAVEGPAPGGLDLPPILPAVHGKPFLGLLMRELQRFGVADFVVCAPKADAVTLDEVTRVADLLPKLATLRFAAPEALARGEGLEPRFLVADADCLFDTNLAALLRDFAADPDPVPARALLRPEAGGPLCLDHVVTRQAVAADADGDRLAHGGILAMDRSALGLLPAGPGGAGSPSLGDWAVHLAHRGALAGTIGHGFFVDIGAPGGLDFAARELPPVLQRPALIVDRDGVLNHDHGYVGDRKRFDWVDGALDALRLAADHGWHVFMVTNQSGVARGLYTEDDVRSLLAWVCDEARRHGGTIDDWRYCPTHPEAPQPAYRREDTWRKPGPGMILHIMDDWDLALDHCLMVGDQDTDMQAARAAGIRGVLFPGGNLLEFLRDIVATERVKVTA
jgi:D-glycero-D-manno-heptose 1,7-bisphosphate phosphatase